jgi:radical SAM superfamily enzyme
LQILRVIFNVAEIERIIPILHQIPPHKVRLEASTQGPTWAQLRHNAINNILKYLEASGAQGNKQQMKNYPWSKNP